MTLLTESADYDEPGSWGRMSEGWPEIVGDYAYSLYLYANKAKSIPYGSYVLMAQKGCYGAEKSILRVHPEYIDKLKSSFHSERALTFNEFRAANRERCLKWHPQGIESWSDSDWITAIVGELGELASLIKMRNRERDGLSGNKFSPTDEQIAREAADVFTYLDLFCERNGINLGLAAVEKFNEVSARVGFPDRINLSA